MGSAINPDEINRFEVTEVYSHPNAKVDIVLVHGLNGHPQKTWTAANGVFWPTQLLPVSLKSSQARILVYGYNADVYAFGSKNSSTDMIHEHAQSLLANLALERQSEETTDHPIIWVAHSLGGILVKRALELSSDLTSNKADNLRSIFVSTYGIIFLGTPHLGADGAKWGLIIQSMVSALVPKKIMDTESQMVRTLMTNNETLQNINLKFNDIYPKFQIVMAHEGAPTDLKGTKAFIVDQNSAGPKLPGVTYFGIEATHSNMCKFETKNSPGYRAVSMTIKQWIENAEPIVAVNWELERLHRRQVRGAQAAELLGLGYQPTPQLPPPQSAPSTPDPSSVNNSTIMVKSTLSIEPSAPEPEEPYFIKPSGFRPNSLFVGRQAELALLHKLLFDPEKRANGTSAVLIHCLPGGGKSHLARQYVYEHKKDFPGGIFWLRAKSHEELAAGFWDIARKVALKNATSTEGASLSDPQQFIKIVKKFLGHRHEWLMVLDGIHFDDVNGLTRFLPDSTNTSLIYTSTEGGVSGDHLVLNPQPLKLPLLSAREAQKLFLLELDKKEPFSKDDLLNSMTLVQSMGFLPVVIHAAAQRLKATDEPLSRFAKSHSSIRWEGLATYKAVVEQLKILKADEALNFIRVVCFFSQHIPVEMVALGLKVLDVPVKAKQPIPTHSLDNTFTILIRFALIERNEQESMHSSQSSRSSREMLVNDVDVIRLHSVVQGFFVSTLAADGQLLDWLDRAVKVFCCSYDMAHERITRKTNAGLVEDYRLYEIHGNKLQQHLLKSVPKHLPKDEKLVLDAAQRVLSRCLTSIKAEIERRTAESSQYIAGGRSEGPQTSIFDRTSSSSDTGPETPGDGTFPPVSQHSSWGLGDKVQLESPLSVTHDHNYAQQINTAEYSSHFPPLQQEKDGYETDREDSPELTPKLPKPKETSPPSPGGTWEEVRHVKRRPKRMDLHRTIDTLNRTKYRDTAGAYRALSSIDPRISQLSPGPSPINPRLSLEAAQGHHSRTPSSRAPSRGRSGISGQSGAEVSLNHISQASPPPARGGGMIQDKRASSSRSDRARLMRSPGTYANAVTNPTTESVTTFPIPINGSSTDQSSESASTSDHPSSLALESLRRIPTTRAPYPPTPQENITPGSPEFFEPMPAGWNYSQENLSLGPTPYPPTIPHQAARNLYPRLVGGPPVEQSTPGAISHTSSPLGKRNYPHDYGTSNPQIYPESSPASMRVTPTHSNLSYPSFHSESPHPLPTQQFQQPMYQSLSTPDIHSAQPHLHLSHTPFPASNLAQYRPSRDTYIPGHPELSGPGMRGDNGGYTSQPMSRNASGQSTHSHRSITATEPNPDLPSFSPRMPLTSYAAYSLISEREAMSMVRSRSASAERGRRGRSNSRGPVRKSPRLGYAGLEEEDIVMEGNNMDPNYQPSNLPPQQRTHQLQHSQQSISSRSAIRPPPAFNPNAQTFTPSPSSSSRIPLAPANSMLSGIRGGSNMSSSYPSPLLGQNQGSPYQNSNQGFYSPNPQQAQRQLEQSPRSFASYPSPIPPPNSRATPNLNQSSFYSTPRSGQEQLRRTRPEAFGAQFHLNSPEAEVDWRNYREIDEGPGFGDEGRGREWMGGERMGGEGMGRTGSGGLRVDGFPGGVIEFGDYPEVVVVDEARGRVEEGRRRREREREGGVGLGIRR